MALLRARGKAFVLQASTQVHWLFGLLLDWASAYAAVIVTSLETMVAVVVSPDGFARIWVSPLQPTNSFPGGGGSAVTVTIVPAAYSPPPLPSLIVRMGAAAVASARAPAPPTEKSRAAFFAPGTGVLPKTESEDGNKFTKGLCNSMSCEEDPIPA
jgi:hypothetical protein